MNDRREGTGQQLARQLTPRSSLKALGLLEGVEPGPEREKRATLLQQLLADGFTVEELLAACKADRLALLPVDRVLHRDQKYTREDLARMTGLPVAFLGRLWQSLGLTDPPEDAVVFGQADLEGVEIVATFRKAGLSEETLDEINQVLGQSMARVTETIVQAVGEALLEAGDNEQTAGLRYAQAAEHLIPLLSPLLGYVLSVQFNHQIKNAVLTQAELARGQLESARDMSVCFADLVSFTALGEGVPPEVLSSAGRQLTEMAMAVARPPVRLVKMIGDAAMLVSPEPEALVSAGLALAAEAERHRESMPRLRVGMARGLAVSEGGDWFGAPVNLASRITDAARPGSVLVTKEIRDGAEARFAWSFAGPKRFKGISAEVPLYRARPLTPEPARALGDDD